MITSPSDEAFSLTFDLLDEIALALDRTSLVLSNWYTLALNLGVPRKTCWTFERENPTSRLFQHLATTCPQKTLLSLKDALASMKRKDLVNFLHEEELKGEVKNVKHCITNNLRLTKPSTFAAWIGKSDSPVFQVVPMYVELNM